MLKLTTYNTKTYLIEILFTNENFRQFIRETLFSNFCFQKIYVKIKNQIKEIAKNEIDF